MGQKEKRVMENSRECPREMTMREKSESQGIGDLKGQRRHCDEEKGIKCHLSSKMTGTGTGLAMMRSLWLL